MQAIKKVRFNALAGYIRNARTQSIGEEKGDLSKIKTTELDVKHNDYSETWTEGLNVFHNPKAKIPLDINFFPDAHHCYGDKFLYPPFYVLNSMTTLLKNKVL